MEINLRQFLLLVIDAAGGKVTGKTYLQKLCFFVGIKLAEPSLGFRPHYYGPYSDPVASELSFLKSAGYVAEQRRGAGFADSSGWEVTRYDYSVTDEGAKAVQSLKQLHGNDAARVSSAVAAVIGAGKLDYMALSVAAKTYWIVSENRAAPVPINKITEQAESLNWKISHDQVVAASDFLEKLDLVKKVPAS